MVSIWPSNVQRPVHTINFHLMSVVAMYMCQCGNIMSESTDTASIYQAYLFVKSFCQKYLIFLIFCL